MQCCKSLSWLRGKRHVVHGAWHDRMRRPSAVEATGLLVFVCDMCY